MKNCHTCPAKDFVHNYCYGCESKPRKSGIMYLHRNNKLLPVESEPVEGAEDELFLIAAHKILQDFRLEFIPNPIQEEG